MNPPLNGVQRYGWCSFIVIFLLSTQDFQLLVSTANLGAHRLYLLSLSLGFQLPTFCAGCCSSAVIFFLSPREFQLPFFRVHGYFSAVIFFLSPQGFQLPFY